MFKERVEKLQNFLKNGEAVIINTYANRLYYTGINSSAGTVIITQRKAYLLIDFRYFENAKRTVTSAEVQLCTKLFKQLNEIFLENKINKVYLEIGSVSVSSFTNYKKAFENIDLSDSDRVERFICDERSIKSQKEIDLISQAQQFTDQTFDFILDKIKVGDTERDIMLQMEFYMRKLGSEGVAFDFIVVSGKNSSLPHGVPTEKQIEKGDFVTMDFGAVFGGYRSDMTRTVAVQMVSDKQKQVYNTVLSAQQAAFDSIREGVRCSDVDKAARELIERAGYIGCFGHGLGHSVGIEIHENPACNTVCQTIMKPGIVMTVEPGIYIENKFGVRIEDMVVVTADGCRNLTKSPKELIIL